MPASFHFAIHRPEITDSLRRGDERIAGLMAGRARTLAAGTVLIEPDARHDFVYRVRQGWVGRVRTLSDGRSQFILIFLPGDLFAVQSMFVTRHSDSVQALSDCVVEQIHHAKLREVYDADRDVSVRCTWQIVEEERRLHNWVVGLGRGDAEERLALLLVDFRARLVLSGTIQADVLSYDLPMTQEQMGDHLGISTVHVNRVLKSLREAGLVTMRGRRVTIHDLEALARFALPLLDSFERAAPEYVGRLAER